MRRVQIVVVIVVAALLLFRRCHTTPIPMSTVRGEFAQLHPPAGAKLTEYDESAKSPTLFVKYDAPLTRDEIGRHYTAMAARTGWQACGGVSVPDWGREVGNYSYGFIKGELSFNVFIPGDPKKYGCRFAVSVGHRQLWPWEDRGCG